jgi:hypothetical protein
MKRTIILPGLVAVFVALSPAGVALADNAHNGGSNTGTGQPNQSTGAANAMTPPPGFNTGGFANAESVYANPGSTGGQASGNQKVVSQYDVASFEFSNRPHH